MFEEPKANRNVVVAFPTSKYFGEEGITTGRSRFGGCEWGVYFPNLHRSCWVWREELVLVEDFDEDMIRLYYGKGARVEARKTLEYKGLLEQELRLYDKASGRYGLEDEEIDSTGLDRSGSERLGAMVRDIIASDLGSKELVRQAWRIKREKGKFTKKAAEEALRAFEETIEEEV